MQHGCGVLRHVPNTHVELAFMPPPSRNLTAVFASQGAARRQGARVHQRGVRARAGGQPGGQQAGAAAGPGHGGKGGAGGAGVEKRLCSGALQNGSKEGATWTQVYVCRAGSRG